MLNFLEKFKIVLGNYKREPGRFYSLSQAFWTRLETFPVYGLRKSDKGVDTDLMSKFYVPHQ